ncbi:MAG: penicillin-binding protein, partial [Pseudomonadota bacterium]|nr:penicillin-binding protein [Pseudomonadota bacterium]
MAKRSDSRRGRSGASNRAAAAKNARQERGGFAKWMRRLVIGGAMAALLVVMFAGLAVAFAARSLPSFYQLQATQVGQTIVVRARD